MIRAIGASKPSAKSARSHGPQNQGMTPPKTKVHVANMDRNCLANFITRNAPAQLGSQATHPHPDTNLPCPGLTSGYDPRIATYLTRSQAAGGGSRPRHVISQALFKKLLGDLDEDKLTKVHQLEVSEFRWLNFREQGIVSSRLCSKKSPSQQEPISPCSECMAVFKDPIFKNALARKLPEDKNLKFTPRGHRANLTGNQYAKTVGVYDLVRKASDVSYFPIFLPWQP